MSVVSPSVNKLDQPALDPFELLDQIERVLGLAAAPMNWPLGDGVDFRGVYDLASNAILFYERSEQRGRRTAPVGVASPNDPEVALAMDMIAPEGYGEIIGGSQRIHDHDLLLQRIKEHNLPVEAFQWYLDVRKYGTFPHSGFGMGIERVVAWISGVPHLRETIPYPRMLNRIYP